MAGGRQREFDTRDALDKAMRVFWQKGYLGASLSDLTGSMGLNKPSMYAAFGNKESLFIAATEHHIQEYVLPLTEALKTDAPLYDRLKTYLDVTIKQQTGSCTPEGCYISLCVTESAAKGLPEKAHECVERAQGFAQLMLEELFQKEAQQGASDFLSSPSVCARLIVNFMHGTAALARGGASEAELCEMVEPQLNAIFRR